MTFGKKTVFFLLLGIALLVNILTFAHVNLLYTTTLLALCSCILLPGFLISLILRIRKLSAWENLIFMVGISIAFLQFGGLLLNILLPLCGVKNPMALPNIVIGFDIYVLLLFVFAWIRTKQFVVQIQLPKRSSSEKVLYVLPMFFPVLATLGAIRLNNGGSNILTLILLGAIAIYSLLLVLFRAKIADDLYPYAIFFIGLASLFTTSLRSWYITGHDIQREFYVFQLTNTHQVWNMAFYQDAYNACLSITILPTMLTHLLSLQDMYVYKVIFQVIFALAPVIVFFIIKKYTTPVYAFLSAFLFIAFPTFFNDMPMLNRQEIGFIFFGLVLYMMLLSELPLLSRRILFVLFGLSVIVSHYSTNFMVLALVGFVYVATRIISVRCVKGPIVWLLSKLRITPKNTYPHAPFLTLPLLLTLFLMTYVWNTLYTHSSNHTGSVISAVVSSLLITSSADDTSSDLSYSIFFAPKPDPKKELKDYIQSIADSEEPTDRAETDPDSFYDEAITSKYPNYPIGQERLALTPLGNVLASFHIPVFNLQAGLRSLSAYCMQIFVFIGFLAILFVKNKKPFDLQYLSLCFGAIGLLLFILVLPVLSVEYGLLRMFQQFLFLLSLPIVLGISSILFFVKEQKSIVFTAIIAITFFLNLTGFFSHLTGDYYPQLTLDNAGLYYNAYYVRKSDVVAIAWLAENKRSNAIVEANLHSTDKLLTYGDINALNGVFPAVIRKNAYVYLEVSDPMVVTIDKNVLIFNSSKSFLDDNKDTIYSNGEISIYK